MKTGIRNLFLLPALIAALGLIPAGRATAQTYINSDGANPYAGLILLNNTLYGTAAAGGIEGNGTVFAIRTDGTGFTNLHSLTYSDGLGPSGEFSLSGNTLYGTAQNGGSFGAGTVFKVNTNGSGFTTLYSFPPGSTNSSGAYANGNGANPLGLIVSGNTLYGTAAGGGSSGFGTVFKVNTDGTEFTNLHSFNYGSDGGNPQAGLVLSGNMLYGTASRGGSSGYGTVFKLSTNGTGFTVLHSFTFGTDGANPNDLVLSSNTLYGTTHGFGTPYGGWGGSSGYGTVFAINTDGTGFTNLYSFTAPFIPPPHLTITLSGTSVVLTWPTNSYAVGGTYVLISTTNLVSQAGWTAVSPPVLVNGQNTVTNSITGTQQFYSLAVGCWFDVDCSGIPCGSCTPDERFNHCTRRCE